MTEQVTGPGKECVGDGADGAIAAIVNMGSRVAGFNACMRDPDLKTIRAQVQAMLASVKVTGLPQETTTTYPPCHIRHQTQPSDLPVIDDSRPCIPPSSGSDP